MTGLRLDLANPAAGNRPGALAYVDDLDRKSLQDWNWKQLSPRLGFAYAATNWMIVRGGCGINNGPQIMNGFDFPGTLGYSGVIM